MLNRLPVQHVRNGADTQDEYIVAYHDGTWLGTVIVTDEAIGSYDDYGDVKVAVESRIQSMVLSENCRGTWYLPKKLRTTEETKHICVWAFYDAPKEYQEMSPHGGDEDWVALIPASRAADFIGWIDDSHHFGCSSVSSHPLPDGREVRIGAHA